MREDSSLSASKSAVSLQTRTESAVRQLSADFTFLQFPGTIVSVQNKNLLMKLHQRFPETESTFSL
jgi:hypothetical protein